jgi:tetratricopeptide (TPR) repeat protein
MPVMNAWRRFLERLLGYEPVGWSWALVRLDPEHQRRSALPERIPVPRREAKRLLSVTRVPPEQVAAYAEAFVRAHPLNAESDALRAFLRKAPFAARIEASLRAEQWSDAERDLREVLEFDPADGRARFLLGLCRLRRGDLEGAGPCFEQAEPVMRADADFLATYGGYWEARGEIDRARGSYHAALAIDAGHAGALERLAALGELVEIYLGTLDSPQKAYLPIAAYEQAIEKGWDETARVARFFLARSHAHLRLGQTRLALKSADRALASVGEGEAPREGIEAWAARCRALLAMERYDEARLAAEKLESLAPDSEWTASCWGHLLWFTGEREEAAAHIKTALARSPDRVEDLLLFLRPEFPGRRREPLAALRHLENSHPQSFTIQSVMASVLMARGMWDEGVEHAVKAARLGAGEDLLVEMTGRLGRQGLHADVCRLAQAAGGWERFLAGDPLLRSNLATALDARGEREAARALWSSLLDDDRAHPALRLRARRSIEGRD